MDEVVDMPAVDGPGLPFIEFYRRWVASGSRWDMSYFVLNRTC